GGTNDIGVLALAPFVPPAASPIAGGSSHTVALKKDGTLWTWGDNSSGQLGSGAPAGSRDRPGRVGNENDWAAIAAGGSHTLGLKADGSLWSWGEDYSGQGNGGHLLDTSFDPGTG